AQMVVIKKGDKIERNKLLRKLLDIFYSRNDYEFQRGTFRVRGDILEIQPIDEEITIRVEFFGDEVERITTVNPVTGEITGSMDEVTIYPASHFVTSAERMTVALELIEAEMRMQVDYFQAAGKLIEAQRIEQRTRMDMEMMRELGYCSGIENYSRYFDGREPGTHPNTLFDYFPEDALVMVDESHQSIPQFRGMYAGDKARKDVLISYGFRLPSAADNRPLKFHEWETKLRQAVFVSATPGPYEREHSTQVAEQVIRPTGLLDPEVIVRPTTGQIDDLIREIRNRTERRERVLVTTLTRKMAEDLSAYLEELQIRVHYIHFGIKTLERTEILRDLRTGTHDVVVGINLLREGLDLPEVSLVAILDADKEGFLRSETSLVQTIGRAARNVNGQVVMYADGITGSMQRAIDETNRRRAIQLAYNEQHGITPQTISKAIRDVISSERAGEEEKARPARRDLTQVEKLPLDQVTELVAQLERQMKEASKALDFERAAEIRDEMLELRRLVPSSAMRGLTGGAEKPVRPNKPGRSPKRAR
ncbi:MAG: excinuclease ABC subunit UvrB, partial [Verrucomicrobiota bacterium]